MYVFCSVLWPESKNSLFFRMHFLNQQSEKSLSCIFNLFCCIFFVTTMGESEVRAIQMAATCNCAAKCHCILHAPLRDHQLITIIIMMGRWMSVPVIRDLNHKSQGGKKIRESPNSLAYILWEPSALSPNFVSIHWVYVEWNLSSSGGFTGKVKRSPKSAGITSNRFWTFLSGSAS